MLPDDPETELQQIVDDTARRIDSMETGESSGDPFGLTPAPDASEPTFTADPFGLVPLDTAPSSEPLRPTETGDLLNLDIAPPVGSTETGDLLNLDTAASSEPLRPTETGDLLNLDIAPPVGPTETGDLLNLEDKQELIDSSEVD